MIVFDKYQPALKQIEPGCPNGLTLAGTQHRKSPTRTGQQPGGQSASAINQKTCRYFEIMRKPVDFPHGTSIFCAPENVQTKLTLVMRPIVFSDGCLAKKARAVRAR
jgi:hypothetical protein